MKSFSNILLFSLVAFAPAQAFACAACGSASSSRAAVPAPPCAAKASTVGAGDAGVGVGGTSVVPYVVCATRSRRPACHTGTRSCFFRAARGETLAEIAKPVEAPASGETR